MSSKSRARNRFEPPAEPPMDPADQADLTEAVDAFELADINPRAGISKWVGVMLQARDRAQQERKPTVRYLDKDGNEIPGESPAEPAALREPTPYVRSLLGGMARKPMYGGTVEPWRVDDRRRRNRTARKTRRAQRLAAKR